MNTGEYCHRTMVVKGMEAMSCDEGEERIAARCFPKTNNGCYSGQQLHAGLCYDKCSSGYSSGGPGKTLSDESSQRVDDLSD